MSNGTNAEKVRCPRCGRKQPRLGPDALYHCPAGCGTFDDDPDEGGSYYNDPSKRLEKQEQFKARRKRR